MALVRVEPGGAAFETAAGETIMAGANRAGYRWPTVCGGQGTCRTCYVRVLEHPENLSTIGPWESEGLAALGLTGDGGPVRLACQARPEGDIVVHKPGVRPPDREDERR